MNLASDTTGSHVPLPASRHPASAFLRARNPVQRMVCVTVVPRRMLFVTTPDASTIDVEHSGRFQRLPTTVVLHGDKISAWGYRGDGKEIP